MDDVHWNGGECIKRNWDSEKERLIYYAFMQLWRSRSSIVCLFSARWRLRKINDIIPVQVWRSGNWGADGINLSPRQEKADISVQSGRQKEEIFSLLFLVLFGPSRDWMMPAHIGEDYLFTEFTDSIAKSHLETPDTIFNLVTTRLVKLTYKINHRRGESTQSTD